MNALSSLLPGLREVRAPLVSGYIWLTVGWLLCGDSLPNRETDATYAHLWILIDAIGPIGDAIVVSIAAYLIGSLVQSAVGSIRSRLMSYLQVRHHLSQLGQAHRWRASRGKPRPESGTLIQVSDLVPLITEEEEPQRRFFFLLPAPQLEASFDDLFRRALEDSRRQIRDAVRRATDANGEDAQVRYVRDGYRSLVEVPQRDRGLVPCLLPEVSPGPIFLSQDRLATVSQRSWHKMEQLIAEAEFREAVALPLFVLVVVLIAQVSVGWITALLLPIALLIQRQSFIRRNAWLAVSALRASVGTQDLDRIAPAFSRHRAETDALVKALDAADWVPAGE